MELGSFGILTIRTAAELCRGDREKSKSLNVREYSVVTGIIECRRTWKYRRGFAARWERSMLLSYPIVSRAT
jgi:hypothetical protein